MKTICGDCGKHMSGDPEDTDISHSRCPSCQKKLLEDARQNARQIWEELKKEKERKEKEEEDKKNEGKK